MEYLTLQDIPHRHCEPLHSRKMTSSHSAERPPANMVAAVSEDAFSLSTLSLSAPAPSRAVEPFFGLKRTLPGEGKLKLPPTPFSFTSSKLPQSTNMEGQERLSFHLPALPTSPPLLLVDPDTNQFRGQRSFASWKTYLTGSQNHHMRSSPPLQPGEQNFPGKLPSFSEVRNEMRFSTPWQYS